MSTSTERQTFRDVLAQAAEQAKLLLPASTNGRIESALRLVLQGDVEPQADGTVTVYSATDATRRYVLQGSSCTCADYERRQAPEGWCAHRIAAGLHKRVGAMLPPAPVVEAAVAPMSKCDIAPPLPLPEAPASVNVHLSIAGRQVQLTLRDSDEWRLLARLEEVLQRFPAPPAPVPGHAQGSQGQEKGWCAVHQCAMQENRKDGRTWYSHRTAEGSWCKGKGR